jgi:hypothetical protein
MNYHSQPDGLYENGGKRESIHFKVTSGPGQTPGGLFSGAASVCFGVDRMSLHVNMRSKMRVAEFTCAGSWAIPGAEPPGFIRGTGDREGTG